MASSSSSKEVCMNVLCRGATSTSTSSSSSSSIDWRKGWNLRSGSCAILCDRCGFAYEQSVFCDTFHLQESGWRECSSCRKRLHCGCIASMSLLQLLDNGGGIECISCINNNNNKKKSSEAPSIPSDEKPTVFSATTVIDNVGELRSTSVENKMDADSIEMVKVLQMGRRAEVIEQNDLLQLLRNDTNGSHCQIKREQGIPPGGEVGCTSISNFNQASIGSYQFTKRDTRKEIMGVKELSQTCLSMNLGGPMGGTIDLALPPSGAAIEGRELSKLPPSLQQIQRSRNLLPKPPKTGLGTAPEATKDMLPQIRVARPPVEGRIKNQLLPRYWPRITEQELQQISGDSNSTIVPLFEKVLSASDAGRIGRLVLPKACAEAYFPPISQPEGLPLRIQDAKGKDWMFQFRFWPNNNSRMYVLEGVTPCIHSMQLQAGDTVTFSRIDPEGKLVMGFRKASNSGTLQDAQISSIANGALANATFYSGVIENLPVISGYSGLFQSLQGSTDPHLNALSEHIRSADGDVNWLNSEKHGRRPNRGLQMQQLLVPEKKKSRNIGSKSKRLLIDSETALELKLTWDEAQDLLRPPPSVKPSIVIVEDHVFEEYEEPPVFGKKTIFTSGGSGGQDQWSQCDSCYKWRRLPVDALLPPNWKCADNTWDLKRCMCSVPDELSPKELENLFRMNMDFKKRRIAIFDKAVSEHEPCSGLDTLATAAVLGENGVDSGTPSVATTTKHPRHRPGCTCIVCIQPPSGKGPKHKPTCTCNVCMTVKRRFKTLMMRKKKRQSEKEAEIAQRKYHMEGGLTDEMEVESSSRCMQSPVDASENETGWLQANESKLGSHNRIQIEKDLESGKSQLDLNCDPSREDDQQGGAGAGLERVSMMSLLQVASRPLETYLKQNGLRSLISEQQTNSSNSNNALVVPPAAAENSEGIIIPPDDENLVSVVQDRRESEVEVEEEEEHCTPDPAQADPV